MNFEEFKNSLLTSHDEGVDSAAVYDTLLTEVSGLYEDLKGKTEAVETLTQRVADMTESNFKLLEKIKYMTADDEPEAEEEKELTVNDIFEEV